MLFPSPPSQHSLVFPPLPCFFFSISLKFLVLSFLLLGFSFSHPPKKISRITRIQFLLNKCVSQVQTFPSELQSQATNCPFDISTCKEFHKHLKLKLSPKNLEHLQSSLPCQQHLPVTEPNNQELFLTLLFYTSFMSNYLQILLHYFSKIIQNQSGPFQLSHEPLNSPPIGFSASSSALLHPILHLINDLLQSCQL